MVSTGGGGNLEAIIYAGVVVDVVCRPPLFLVFAFSKVLVPRSMKDEEFSEQPQKRGAQTVRYIYLYMPLCWQS